MWWPRIASASFWTGGNVLDGSMDLKDELGSESDPCLRVS
jgi:hypothetical protein